VSGSTLDRLDERIITLLQEDGRMSSRIMAERLGVSDRTVRYRIDRLVKSGAIIVAAMVDPTVIGWPVSADLKITVMRPHTRSVAKALGEINEVMYVSLNEREGVVLATIIARSEPDAFRFVKTEIMPLEGVLKVATTIETDYIKDAAGWAPPAD
jgi:Lrp/AsnC family transcriptional regulator for asnA, asnC and gidA